MQSSADRNNRRHVDACVIVCDQEPARLRRESSADQLIERKRRNDVRRNSEDFENAKKAEFKNGLNSHRACGRVRSDP